MREGMLGDGSSPPLNPSECELKQEKLGMGWDGWCEGTQETWCGMCGICFCFFPINKSRLGHCPNP